MQIDREQIVTFFQEQGNLDTAQQALSSLPQMVDTSEHAQLLEQIGIDPTQLMEGLGLTDHLDSFNSGIDEHQDTFANLTDGGPEGIFEKLKDFISSRI